MAVSFQNLDNLPASVAHADVIAAFRPFFCPAAQSSEGERQLRLIRWNAAKRAVRRALGGSSSGTRSKQGITGEYEVARVFGL